MPCILKVKILQARNLPVMDRATELAGKNAFVEVRFSDFEAYRTNIQRRTLNPVWNEDFRFEVSDDADLQNEPLEIKVMDYDQITYNDAIGTVFIDLNSLLAWDSLQISGWLPIFDTLRGIRGELNCQVKIQFFGDINPFKDSSAGVQFFTLKKIPTTRQLVQVLGFVGALDSEDDPEYHWSDNFRTPRTSNEARTRVMYRLSGQLRRQLGKKVLEMGGNAVIGYTQNFDLDAEERTIFARAIGTAVKLRNDDLNSPILVLCESVPTSLSSPVLSPIRTSPLEMTRPFADTDVDSISPTSSMHAIAIPLAPQYTQTSLRVFEGSILTMDILPLKCILGLGGYVSVASVKIITNDEVDIRESWWAELRDEIRSHSRALGCAGNVIGYSEHLTIEDDLVVLHCTGTAALLDVSAFNEKFEVGEDIQDEYPTLKKQSRQKRGINSADIGCQTGEKLEDGEDNEDGYATLKKQSCQACHITYKRQDTPFPMSFVKCGLCRKRYVPEILLCTIEPPSDLETIGKGTLLEAHVCRQKKTKVGESNANIVSESIPFALFDIHRQLMYKLRIYGLNAIFGLQIKMTIGEAFMTAVATGTAIYVKALPPPPSLKVFRNLEVVDDEDIKLLEIQKRIMAQSELNRRQIELALNESKKSFVDGVDEDIDEPFDHSDPAINVDSRPSTSLRRRNSSKIANEGAYSSDSSSDSDDDLEKSGNKRSVVVQIDDEQDEDVILLMDPTFPEGFQLLSIESLTPEKNANVQMITMVKQGLINSISHHPNRQLSNIFKSLYQELQFQLSYFSPCVVAGIKYDIQLPKDNEVQIQMTAIAIGQLISTQGSQGEGVFDMLEALAISDSFSLPSTTSSPIPGFMNLQQSFNSKILSKFPTRQGTLMSMISTKQTELSLSDDGIFELDEIDAKRESLDSNRSLERLGTNESVRVLQTELNASPLHIITTPQFAVKETGYSQEVTSIEITPLSYIPNARIDRYLGRLSMHFVKEANLVFEAGLGSFGMGGFTHMFIGELYALIRAHTNALGGNGLISYQIDQCVISESIKNQGYSFFSVSGDVVWFTKT